MLDARKTARRAVALAMLIFAGAALVPRATQAQVFPLHVADYRGIGVYSLDAAGTLTERGFVDGPLNSVRRDRDGNLYTCREDGPDVSRIDPAGVVTVYATGFGGCFGLLFGPDGTLYVSNIGGGSIDAVPPGGGPATTFAVKLSTPAHMAMTADGAILVAELSGGALARVDASGGVTRIATGLDTPVGVAIAADGNAFVSELFSGRIVRVTPGGTTSPVTTLADAGPAGLAFHQDGRLFVAEFFAQRIETVDVATGATSLFRANLAAPVGLEFLASPAAPLPITVSVDVKPGDGAVVNPWSRGLTPVAILGAAGFAVERVDVSSVRLGVSGSEAAVAHSAIEDVNRDGIPDIVLHFRTRELGIAAGLPRGSSVSLQLTGVTVDGVAIEGTDTVRVTGPGR